MAMLNQADILLDRKIYPPIPVVWCSSCFLCADFVGGLLFWIFFWILVLDLVFGLVFA